MQKLAPICLFTYNRLEETKQTIAALQKNNLASQSKLYIFSDGPKNTQSLIKINNLRAYLKEIKGFKEVNIYESKENKGLAESIISGITKMFESHETVIVMEDDLVTTPNFLDFMNQALKFYNQDNNIYTVNGYSPFIKNLNHEGFFQHTRSFPWGWATWKDRWNIDFFDKKQIRTILNNNTSLLRRFDNDCGQDASKMLLDTLKGTTSSWYIRWVFHNYLLEKKSIFPVTSKVQNIGDTESATHYSGGISAYKSLLDHTYNTKFDFTNKIVLAKNNYNFLKYFSKKYKLIYRLKLIAKKGGLKKISQEIKTKFLK